MKRLTRTCASLAAGAMLILAPAPALGLTAASASTVAAPRPVPHLTASHHHALHSQVYTVRHGDTLSSIAKARLGLTRRWEGLYAANRARVGANPNAVTVGTGLRLVNAGLTANMARHIHHVLNPPPPPVVHHAAVAAAAPAPPAAAPAAPAAAPAQAPASTYHGGSSMEQCIIAAESGGNSQVMNATGHYGLYQFSAGTWAAHGGNPADFGHASVAEQQQVFANTVAANGYSDWTPYDGC